jgi:hypothetical protein
MQQIHLFTTQLSTILFFNGAENGFSFVDITDKAISFPTLDYKIVDTEEEIGKQVWFENQETISDTSLTKDFDENKAEKLFEDCRAELTEFTIDDFETDLDKTQFLLDLHNYLYTIVEKQMSIYYLPIKKL